MSLFCLSLSLLVRIKMCVCVRVCTCVIYSTHRSAVRCMTLPLNSARWLFFPTNMKNCNPGAALYVSCFNQWKMCRADTYSTEKRKGVVVQPMLRLLQLTTTSHHKSSKFCNKYESTETEPWLCSCNLQKILSHLKRKKNK